MAILKSNIMVMFILLIGFVNSACQTVTSIYEPEQRFRVDALYADHVFSGYQNHNIESEHEIFALTPQMIDLISREIKSNKPIEQQVYDLLNLIFDEKQIGLAYKNTATLTASETFKNREANCISLTIMAYSLAKQANLSVDFQDVKVPEYWIRNDGYSLLTGHVNLMVSDHKVDHQMYVVIPDKIVIDFDPFVRKKNFPAKRVNKQTIIAMFYTNKAAQAIIDEKYSLAYAYLKQATRLAPKFSPAWGNLGILYKLNNIEKLAINVYEHAISLDPDNYTAINNLAILFNKVGREKDADIIRQKLHELRIKNPYYNALLANNAYLEGNYQQAISMYHSAIKLDDKQHEFYFGLAKAYTAQGNVFLAKQALKSAIKFNKYKDVEKRYYAKLNFLRGSALYIN